MNFSQRKTRVSRSVLALGTIAFAAAADASLPPVNKVAQALKKLKSECDNPKVSNESYWTSYCSATELKRCYYIAELKSAGEMAVPEVQRELSAAKSEYREMLVVALAALGDNTSIWQAGRLMLRAKRPAVRVSAASELRRLQDKRLMEPFKQALRDPFKRMDGACVNRGVIYPVRLIASGGLVALGMPLEEVQKLGKWWDDTPQARLPQLNSRIKPVAPSRARLLYGTDGRQWANPYLVTREEGIEIITKAPHPGRMIVPAHQLRMALAALPVSAWPHAELWPPPKSVSTAFQRAARC